jgi:hypothetical protein
MGEHPRGPTVTLNVHSHLFGNTDERAAAIVEYLDRGLAEGMRFELTIRL